MGKQQSDDGLAGFSTRAIHHGYDPLGHEGALTPPLHLSSTFAFETAQCGGERFSGQADGHVYTRISNPTNALLEARIANLEGAEAGLATASGMGAITSVLWTFLSPGDEILADKTLYGCTFAFLIHQLTRFGVHVRQADFTDPRAVREAINDRTKIVYFETPSNPNMRLVDIEAISAIARAHGARCVVDNTYATPFVTRPLEHGADIVVHSATKYLGGHGDLVAGLVVGSAEDVSQVRLVGVKDMTGAALAPFNAMLVLRGLKTLSLRMQRHSESAQAIACWLQGHQAVKRVFYPGLATGGQKDIAAKQMSLPGGMIAFELYGTDAEALAFMNRLKRIVRAVSLGDAETLIQHPASMTHSTYSVQERAKYGISEGLLRLSIGLEEVEDIKADLETALMDHRFKAAG